MMRKLRRSTCSRGKGEKGRDRKQGRDVQQGNALDRCGALFLGCGAFAYATMTSAATCLAPWANSLSLIDVCIARVQWMLREAMAFAAAAPQDSNFCFRLSLIEIQHQWIGCLCVCAQYADDDIILGLRLKRRELHSEEVEVHQSRA
eukprot:1158375-Pelagomonas_calceolata.AAC.12